MAGERRSRSARGARRPTRRPAHPPRVALLLLVALLRVVALGCGARTDPPGQGDEGLDESAGGDGVEPVDPAGSCAACDGSVVCTHCYIQGYDVTYRCRPDQPAPSPSCLGLGEAHTDQFGASYTCFYCG